MVAQEDKDDPQASALMNSLGPLAGIIPRAAQALFEKLDGTKHTRNSSSSTGLRTPQRYSMSSASSFARPTVEKNWQLKATYVEVRRPQVDVICLSPLP